MTIYIEVQQVPELPKTRTENTTNNPERGAYLIENFRIVLHGGKDLATPQSQVRNKNKGEGKVIRHLTDLAARTRYRMPRKIPKIATAAEAMVIIGVFKSSKVPVMAVTRPESALPSIISSDGVSIRNAAPTRD